MFIWGDLETGPPIVSMEPILTLTAVARATSRIGLVPSASTSFNKPYGLARQLRALDVMSHGRAGWNAIPSYEPEAFANYGLPVPGREDKYERLHEVVQITQALWGAGIQRRVYDTDIDTIADELVPELQRRGLFHTEYRGKTLRDHLDVPYQYGPDPRIS